MLLLINHQRLLIKLISLPEIELLITTGTPENQKFKRCGLNRHVVKADKTQNAIFVHKEMTAI